MRAVNRQRRGFIQYLLWLSKFQSDKSVLPKFDSVTDYHIEAESGMKAEQVYKNSLYWRPRFYQQTYLSQIFLDEVTKFKKKRVWRNHDTLALTQLILIEATRDTTFDVSFSYQAEPSDLCGFHG